MLDPQVTHLLETAINTSCKLAIMLKFLDHRSLSATSSEMASRVCRDIWSVDTALNELADDGILCRRDNRFVFEPTRELHSIVNRLHEMYADPLQRDELQQIIRDVERYAPYRHVLPRQFFSKLAA